MIAARNTGESQSRSHSRSAVTRLFSGGGPQPASSRSEARTAPRIPVSEFAEHSGESPSALPLPRYWTAAIASAS